MKCTRCNHKVEDGEKFCNDCKTIMKEEKKHCEKCTNELSEDDKFCNKCGKEVKHKQPPVKKKKNKKILLSGAVLVLFLGVFLSYIIVQSFGQKTTKDVTANKEESEDEKILRDKFSFYDSLLTKEEMEEYVDAYYEEENEPSYLTLLEQIEEEFGSENMDALRHGLFIDEQMSLFDKNQVLLQLGAENNSISAKVVTNPIDFPKNLVEEENRFRSLIELDIIESRFFGEEELIVDTEGFIEASSDGVNLGYPILDSYFYEDDDYIRGIEFAIHHYVEEDIPYEVEPMVEHFEKLYEGLDVQINGYDLREFLFEDIDGEAYDNRHAYIEEELESMKEKGNENKYYLLKDSIITIHLILPLDIVVKVPSYTSPLSGEIHELFYDDIIEENIRITINGEESSMELAGDNIFSTYINPEIRQKH